MAKVTQMPDGSAIMARIKAGQMPSASPYGTRCIVEHDDRRDTLILRRSSDRKWLVVYRDGKELALNLPAMDPLVLPYVHMFSAHEGVELRRIAAGRTGAGGYAVVGTRRVNVAAAMTSPAPTDLIEDEDTDASDLDPTDPVVPTAHGTGATIMVTAPTTPKESKLATVPGVLFPDGKGKVKSAGTAGYVEVDGVVIPKDDLTTLDDAWTLRQQGESGGVLITGPSGTAKSHLVRAWANARGIPYLKVDGGSIRTVDDWVGGIRQDVATGNLAYRWSPFAQALRANEPLVINVDELTRSESSAALNGLLGLMDDSGTLSVPEGNAVLTLPTNVLVVATANIGPEFSGTLPLDGAVRQRFALSGGIRMDYPTPAIEARLLVSRYGIGRDVADTLVQFAGVQRKDRMDFNMYPSRAVVSTRLLLSMARNVGLVGTEVRQSVIRVCKTQFNEADDNALSVAIDAHFPKVVAPKPSASSEANIVVGRHWFHGSGASCEYVADGKYDMCLQPKAHGIHHGS